MSQTLCPCTSGKPYNSCCGPLLQRNVAAKTVKQLVRSRYCSYALGGHGEFLLVSWHPCYARALTTVSLSEKTQNWQGLKILEYQQRGDEGMVKFEASYLNEDGSTGLHQEISRFVREDGKWFYLDGELTINND